MSSRALIRIMALILCLLSIVSALVALMFTPALVAERFSRDGFLDPSTVKQIEIVRLAAGAAAIFGFLLSLLFFVRPSLVNSLVSRLRDNVLFRPLLLLILLVLWPVFNFRLWFPLFLGGSIGLTFVLLWRKARNKADMGHDASLGRIKESKAYHFFVKYEVPVLLLGAFSCVLLLFAVHFGFAILVPTNFAWLMEEGDWAQHYLGWKFFRDEPWQLPLGDFANYCYPVGANIGYMDSIPILAISLKSLSGYLPADFQYLGMWLFVCYLLQAVFAVLLIETLRVGLPAKFFMVPFLVLAPVLIFRSMHPALCSHWLILASLYSYFRTADSVIKYRILGMQLFLLLVSAFIHPYMTVMVFGLTVALLWRMIWIDKTITLKEGLLRLAGGVGSVVIAWFAIGYLHTNMMGYEGRGGYGIYSANLNAFVNSMGQTSLLQSLPKIGNGQYEGFGYLGLGMLLLCWIAVLVRFREFPVTDMPSDRVAGRNVPIVVIAIAFSIFSFSNSITWNSQVIFHYEINRFFMTPLETFRSSGRFLWPAYYLTMFLTFSYLVSRKQHVGISISTVLLTAMIVQLIDVSGMVNPAQFSKSVYKPPLQIQALGDMMSQAKKVLFYPPLKYNYNESHDYRHFAYYAAERKVPINVCYIARYRQDPLPYMREFSDALNAGRFENDVLYVTTKDYAPLFQQAVGAGILSERKIDGYYTYVKHHP